MPAILLALKAWLVWLVAKKAAWIAIVVSLGTWLSGVTTWVADTVFWYVNQTSAEVYQVLCIAGVWEGFEILLLAGTWAFWFWAIRAFFNAKAI